MATHSTIPAARAKIVALLLARPALSGVPVDAWWPKNIEREHIYCGEARATSDIPVMTAGRKRREESYVIELWVQATATGQSGTDAEARAQVFLAEIEDMLADDPNLGGVMGTTGRAHLSGYDWNTGPSDEGYGSTVRIEVSCSARLS